MHNIKRKHPRVRFNVLTAAFTHYGADRDIAR